VNFSNLSFSDVNRFKNPQTYSTNAFGGGGTNGAPISGLQLTALSGLAGSPIHPSTLLRDTSTALIAALRN